MKRKLALGSRVILNGFNKNKTKGCVTYGRYSGEYIDLTEGMVHVLWDDGRTEWLYIKEVRVIEG